MRALSLSLLLLVGSAHADAAPSPTFAGLKALVGEWVAPTPRGAIKVSYRLVSNDSALVQRFVTPSGRETLTIIHPDGDKILATHYCAQGNQPRLRLDLGKSSANRYVFSFVDATNLATPAASHLVQLELVLAGDQYTEVETYEENGKPDVTTLRFRRVH
jgi:hypothetical protein